MTRTWARELCERATINAINPGPVATEMWDFVGEGFQRSLAPWTLHTPLAKVRDGLDAQDLVTNSEIAGGRPAYESEIAGIVGMLCTPEAGWCTGSVICANGGMSFTR